MSTKPVRKKAKHGGGHEEEHENHERWLITYADMLTLLMVLFIVMFAMSAVDQRKFQALANGLAEGFGSPSVAFQGKTGTLDTDAKSAALSVDSAVPKLQDGLNMGVEAAPNRKADADKRAVAAADRARASASAGRAVREVKNLRKVQEKITKALRARKLDDSVRFRITEKGLIVSVVSSDVVFAGDRAELLVGGRRIMEAIAPALRDLPNDIQVDGHTNQLPVPTVNYPSAWELSTARASTVVRFLTGFGLPEQRLSAAGYAGTRPLFPPSDPRAARLNRRVDIVVLSTLDSADRALLPSASGPAKATTGHSGTASEPAAGEHAAAEPTHD
jgi:chemotaxis protein MotB